jgi:hypothetical protein
VTRAALWVAAVKREVALVEFHFPDRVFVMSADRGRFAGAPAPSARPSRRRRRRFSCGTAGHSRAPRLSLRLRPRAEDDRGGWAAYFGYGADQISGLAMAVFTEACFDGGAYQPVAESGRHARCLEVRSRSGRAAVQVATSVAMTSCSPTCSVGWRSI